jgi:hypothetical protein
VIEVVNLTNHIMMINADKYTPTDERLIPAGEMYIRLLFELQTDAP